MDHHVSLCPGWTVHDVVAHLALNTEDTTLGFVLGLIRARGNFDRMSFDQARMESTESSPDALITRLRHNAGSPQRAPGSSHLDPFLDVIIHGQDIASPSTAASDSTLPGGTRPRTRRDQPLLRSTETIPWRAADRHRHRVEPRHGPARSLWSGRRSTTRVDRTARRADHADR